MIHAAQTCCKNVAGGSLPLIIRELGLHHFVGHGYSTPNQGILENMFSSTISHHCKQMTHRQLCAANDKKGIYNI